MEKKLALKVSITTILLNIFLTILKALLGFYGHSYALIMDAVHSLSDVLSTFIVIIGVVLSHRHSDKNHPYGHERLECVASLILALLLLWAGLYMGFSGLQKLYMRIPSNPTSIALIGAILSIIVKEWMFLYTKKIALKIHSSSLMADAYHHHSDGLSSIGSFLGIIGSLLGFPFLDHVATLFICLIIIKLSFEILYDALQRLVDHASSEAIESKIIKLVLSDQDVISLDSLKTRLFGSKIYVDLEIGCLETLSLKEAHTIAHRIHDQLEQEIPLIKHCMIHVNPKK